MIYKLRLSGKQHQELKKHLLPADGREAAALLLCGQRAGERCHVLCAHELQLLPYDACDRRSSALVSWPSNLALPFINSAMKKGMALMKIHSHPGGYEGFSQIDDQSDTSFLSATHNMLEHNMTCHGSSIMLPDGRIFGRVMPIDSDFRRIDRVCVAEHDLHYWFAEKEYLLPDFVLRHAQAFGEGTISLLSRLSIAVVGCSGTGTPVIEQLVRLGVGHLVLIDPDYVEEKNLNRMYMTQMADAFARRRKVDVLKQRIDGIGVGTCVETYASDVANPTAVKAVAECDILFGCVDTVAGRDLLNRIASFYSIPYFDIGVGLTPRVGGGINQINGVVHYVQPGASSLLSRGLYTTTELRNEWLRKEDPNEFDRQKGEGYIEGVNENRPAVISVNTQMAALAVNDLLARLHPYRNDSNADYAAQHMVFHEGFIAKKAESEFAGCEVLSPYVGRGDVTPLLNRPNLSEGM